MGNIVEVDIATYRLLTERRNMDLIVASASSITAEVMIKNISKPSGNGKAYKRRGGIGYHIASAAGDYPAKDSGALAGSISVSLGRNPEESDVLIQSDYALDLEYGTSRMRSRPFIINSLNEAMSTRLPEIINKVVSYINLNKPADVKPMLEKTIRNASDSIAEAKAAVEELLSKRPNLSIPSDLRLSSGSESESSR